MADAPFVLYQAPGYPIDLSARFAFGTIGRMLVAVVSRGPLPGRATLSGITGTALLPDTSLVAIWSISVLNGVMEMLYLFVFTHSLTENRFTLFLEMLYVSALPS